MSFTSDLEAARAKSEEQEDREAFSYGVQIANEQILRGILEYTLAMVEPAKRKGLAEHFRSGVETTIAMRLKAARVPDGIEAKSAASIVASVFDGLAADPQPGEPSA